MGFATRLLALVVLGCALAGPAAAYEPCVGARAADIAGRDAVSDMPVALSDHSGKWVFVDFWASWCGPCMDELPNLLEVTKPLRRRDDFALFTVSLDAPETDADLNKVIRDHRIDYPVVYDGGGWDSVQAVEWGVRSIPATFLVDPRGTVVAAGLRGEALAPALDFFLNYPGEYVPISLSATHSKADDGTLNVRVQICNPRRTPVQLRAEWYSLVNIYAEDDPEHANPPLDRLFVEPDSEKPEHTASVTFAEWSDSVYTFSIPPTPDAAMTGYEVSIMLPETEALMNGAGIWVSDGGREKFD